MTNLSELLFASLLLQRRDRDGDRRGSIFADPCSDNADFRAARERARNKRT